ncbi:DUF445 domain-containing protein [Pacificimonas sp. WHA3]|uniref:DUF445 domain-containing protein n=1 Tax=Pacificimonas pallii TaxID=2827236 RepID=A0ABS6SDH0_9SPHN|nr:DUF445 domain-containing protein [Pacificimonas pallii]MBV7255971.1 DUF445 domain-containing protein [Pacificimonas pallii]
MQPHPARRMRVVATGLLIAMACLFVVTHRLEGEAAWIGYLNAFSEAAMIGGLADWFAVVALFRHPLGLPIPHTAIVPKNKDRLADNLAGFLQDNFLTTRIVARRLAAFDMAGAAGRWLARPSAGGTKANGAARFALQVMDAADNDAVSGLVRGGISSGLGRLELAPLLGRILDRSIDEGRLQPVFDSAIVWLAHVLDQNELLIRDLVQERTQWLLRVAGVDDRVANALINGSRKLLVDMAADPDHPLRIKVMIALKDVAFDLQYLPETQEKVEQYKHDLIANPELARFLDGIWGNLKEALRTSLSDPQAALSGRLGEGLRSLGSSIETDPALRRSLNMQARRALASLIADYGAQIVSVVSDTVKKWDTETVADRLERAVGRDLQFIRVNGTLVGGLVGVVLHALVTAF